MNSPSVLKDENKLKEKEDPKLFFVEEKPSFSDFQKVTISIISLI